MVSELSVLFVVQLFWQTSVSPIIPLLYGELSTRQFPYVGPAPIIGAAHGIPPSPTIQRIEKPRLSLRPAEWTG
jgi:hypothetical protein